jgi:hypothetical protein
MGYIQYTLGYPFEGYITYLTKKDGKDDRRGKTKNQPIDVEEQGVSQEVNELGGSKKTLEMGKAHPFAAPYTVYDPVIFEGDDSPVHRTVAKNEVIRQGDDQKQIKPITTAKISDQKPLLFVPCL